MTTRSSTPALRAERTVLDERTVVDAAHTLADGDPDLAAILARHGPPPLWAREPGFETLVAIVLEQQVSLASGAAALARLRTAAGAIRPDALVDLGEDGARAAGLTRQKARYAVELGRAMLDGRLDLDGVAAADDGAARTALTSQLGIGRWTADIYLIMALRRPDVWPDGDLALATAMRWAKRLPTIPTSADQRAIAQAWRPWRAVAARLLWHAYLGGDR
jgi:DNA-3-methyladenine glycosylase II